MNVYVLVSTIDPEHLHQRSVPDPISIYQLRTIRFGGIMFWKGYLTTVGASGGSKPKWAPHDVVVSYNEARPVSFLCASPTIARPHLTFLGESPLFSLHIQ